MLLAQAMAAQGGILNGSVGSVHEPIMCDDSFQRISDLLRSVEISTGRWKLS